MLAAGLTQRDAIIDASAQDLRDVGLSWQKARYAKALAMSGIDFDALRLIDDAQVIAQLVTVTGIGTWTAEIYAMFALGRADVFAPGDLALQEGARLLFDLEARPSERGLRAMSQAWSPWRSVAARILWAYYHVEKRREGIK
jgi:DNA-3-methyladenine glycosylase II